MLFYNLLYLEKVKKLENANDSKPAWESMNVNIYNKSKKI